MTSGRYERRDCWQTVEVVGIHLVRLDLHGEAFLEERDKLDRCDGIENSASDQRSSVVKRFRTLARKKLAQDVVLNDGLDVRFCIESM